MKPVHLVGDFDADYYIHRQRRACLLVSNRQELPAGKGHRDRYSQTGRRSTGSTSSRSRPRRWKARRGRRPFLARYLKTHRRWSACSTLPGRYCGDVELPGIGTADGFEGKRRDKETFYSFTSFTNPAAIYRYDVATGASTVWRQPKLSFNPQDYETTQVFYRARMGPRSRCS